MKRHTRWWAGALALTAALGTAAARAEIVVAPVQAPPALEAPDARPALNVPPPLAAPGGEGDAKGGEDLLAFGNGDLLHGALAAMDGAGGTLTWRHAGVAQPIVFGLKGAGRATLGTREAEGRRAQPGRVYLTNGDLLTGEVVSLDAAKLVVNTWYAGTLSVERALVRRILPNERASSALYEGPRSLAEWSTRGGRQKFWEFKNHALYPLQSVPLGRTITNMPERVRVEFEAAWQSTPYFNFWFFCDKPDSPEGEAYYLNFMGGGRAELGRMTREEGTQNLGYTDLPGLRNENRGRARFTILADRKEHKVALMVNDTLAKEWLDPREFKGTGKAILFMPNQGGNLKFSRIRVLPWDGKIPRADAAKEAGADDLISFANGDTLSGRLQTIASRQLRLETAYAPLDVPIERVTEMTLAADKSGRARRNKGDIRMRFADGGELTVKLAGLADGRVKGSSENFGEIAVPLGALAQIEFNIYDHDQKNEQESDDF